MKLYGTPVLGRLWVRHYPVPEATSQKVTKAQIRQIYWELLARKADRRQFQPERTQILLPAKAVASPATYGAAVRRAEALRRYVRLTVSLPSRRMEVDEGR